MSWPCPIRQVGGFRKNIGWLGPEMRRASEAELFSATPRILPGFGTGGRHWIWSMGISCSSAGALWA